MPLILSGTNGISSNNSTWIQPTATGATLNGNVTLGGNVTVNGTSFVAPNKPAAFVRKDNAHITSSQTIVFDVVINQIGSMYNTSNGRFTCPSAGWYLLGFSTLLWNMGGSSNVQIRRNGGSYGPSAIMYGQFSGSYAIQGATHMVYAASAGDYFELFHTHSTTNQHQGYIAASFIQMG
jgi:hypothetical protein